MEGVKFITEFISDHAEIFDYLNKNVVWDERMAARKTASYGVAYNYSQITYPELAFPPIIASVISQLNSTLDFAPNNCLINYYLDGKSKMGWHSDQIDILAPKTGIAIVSLGATRILRFREIENKDHKIDFELPSGSLIYMNQAVQKKWHHAIPKSTMDAGRMSLTFREIIQ